ncbi:MAG: hypothetical protein A2275_18575 [Bacteroidetes bacterium RIFOXYA12_FULL_35_11]|nr:MAG: hypothetical protein A2X01_02020 [Bacteroidetes bacterium GWF2_35_48]OFY83616.1 MAG: hypothetical protein A2275_18575 [Bacteroidetes bacterium RIFOXYA12_FULL_35_11]OFY94254.1 MAG: hypothetical protein A2309_07455 [Bacteroidetes bacterium RIFOXYB2_FULL_35_7]OFY94529.1 MAG: hypothetical protein A2491_13535 [Bacteroidetes bacterium RIFOXYC12_FULL_35_7]HBX51924.1 hypothetical protein [Bacteroidales bacterium]
MKTNFISMKKMFLLAFALMSINMYGQENKANKPVIGVLNIDTKGINMQPDQMGNLLRIEIEKLDTFAVIDRYDALYLIEKNNIIVNNCYGKICLVENGKLLKADKMIGGSVEIFGDIIIISLRYIDVKSESIEKTQVKEFLNLQNELQSMIKITVNEMFGYHNDQDLIMRLTKKFNYENLTTNPDKNIVKLSGPRLGFITYTGKNAQYLSDAKNKGGFDAFPMMFQFGYQFEKQYLNEGNFQALFEFVPMITGLDQGFFVPSVTVMHGLRNNKWGWEFAFGPTINVNTYAKGYYDSNNNWVTRYDDNFISEGIPLTERLDSRGYAKLTTGFIFACGKTFKSGKLNIPVNVWLRPDKNGWMFGASFGFNARKDNDLKLK